jgi:putative transposase
MMQDRVSVCPMPSASGFSSMSERRACRVVGADRKSVRYRSTRPDDADLRQRLRALAAKRRRFGYRRLNILLRRNGVLVNRQKTQRLYTE